MCLLSNRDRVCSHRLVPRDAPCRTLRAPGITYCKLKVRRGPLDTLQGSVLEWWSINGNSFKQWACAARIVFAMSPNSASCERVFSILSLMFGDTQLGSLADMIRAALMLRYNDRVIG